MEEAREAAELADQVSARRVVDLQSAHDTGDGDGCSALYVVVIAEVLLAVSREEREGVV